MKNAPIIDTCGTPRGIGKAGKGGLSALHSQNLGARVLNAIVERNSIDTAYELTTNRQKFPVSLRIAVCLSPEWQVQHSAFQVRTLV